MMATTGWRESVCDARVIVQRLAAVYGTGQVRVVADEPWMVLVAECSGPIPHGLEAMSAAVSVEMGQLVEIRSISAFPASRRRDVWQRAQVVGIRSWVPETPVNPNT